MRALLVLTVGAAVGALTTFALRTPSSAQTASGVEPARSLPSSSRSPAAAPSGAASASNELFRAALPDMPGKQLVVVSLQFPMTNAAKAPSHQHPGSVYVYVTKGEARLGVAGQEPRVVPAGQGFFEPVGAIHNVNESTGTDPATAIAFMIVPEGAPLVTFPSHVAH